MIPTFDAIVVGAGYIGSSVAYQLCAAGLRTRLFLTKARWQPAPRGGITATFRTQDMELSKSVELIRLARTCLAKLEEKLQWKVGLMRIGGLLLIENENQWKLMEAMLKNFAIEGILSELVPTNHLQELEPSLIPLLFWVPFITLRGQADPFQLIWGYLVQARHLGLKEYYFNEVTGFKVQSGRLEGIVTSCGSYSTDTVVLCTGANTRHLGSLLGREWDIQYTIGQAMVTEPVEPVLHNHISSASFFEEEALGELGAIRVGLAIGQSPHGHLLLGEAINGRCCLPAPDAGSILTGGGIVCLARISVLPPASHSSGSGRHPWLIPRMHVPGWVRFQE